MREAFVLWFAIPLVLAAADAQALTIASYTHHFSFGGSATPGYGPTTGIRYDLYFKNLPPAYSGYGINSQFLFGGTDPLSAGLVLAEADVGSTFVAAAGTPGFSWVSTLLTNGSDDTVGFLTGIAPYSTAGVLKFTEFSFFQGLAGFPNPDLAGFDLTAITLTVVALDLNIYSGDGSAVGDVRIDFVGTPVPEPTPTAMVALGLLGLAALPGAVRINPPIARHARSRDERDPAHDQAATPSTSEVLPMT